MRSETLAAMKAKGLVPEDTDLTDRPEGVRPWDELSDTERTVFSRLMEAYAGFAEHTDAQVMRLIEALEDMGKYEDTLFIYIAGDNGAGAEGGLDGTFNELMALNGIPQVLEDFLPRLDEVGSPTAFNHYPVGWAHAMNTPFQYTKQVASHYGGTRNALAVSWPKGIEARGEVRQQWHHVIDIVPTILEAANLPEPYMVNGVAQKPIEGVSMAYTFDNPEADDRHVTQYFEMFGNRGIYHEDFNLEKRDRLLQERGDDVLQAFLNNTGTELGEISEDGLFTVIEAECLAACGFPTCVQINSSYYENVNPGDVPAILDRLRAEGN